MHIQFFYTNVLYVFDYKYVYGIKPGNKLLLKIILDIVCYQNDIFNSDTIILYRYLLEDTGLTQRGARNA